MDCVEGDPPGMDPADDARLADLLLVGVDAAVVARMAGVLDREGVEMRERAGRATRIAVYGCGSTASGLIAAWTDLVG
jgi:hypothetical protein